MIRVDVADADIREGRAADCDACPVALALTRATGEDSRVILHSYTLYIEVGWRCLKAPVEVVDFVHAFDDLPEATEVHPRCHPFVPVLPDVLPEEISPFSFELPDLASAEWKEECPVCEQLFAPDELDEDGCCKTCREK